MIFLKFRYLGILLVRRGNNTRKGSNNRLVDAEYFTDSYWMHIVLFPMFLCRVLVRLWVVGFESDFGVVVRVRWPIDAVPAASVQRHFRKP